MRIRQRNDAFFPFSKAFSDSAQIRELQEIIKFLQRNLRESVDEVREEFDLEEIKAKVDQLEVSVVNLQSQLYALSQDVVFLEAVQRVVNKDLDNTSIGRLAPQDGQFDPLLLRNEINKPFTVPAGSTMIVPDGFQVNETLILQGNLQVI